jgi:hypothetical protein
MKTTTHHPTRTQSSAPADRMLSRQAASSGLLGRYRAAVLALAIGFVVSLAGAVALMHADTIAAYATSTVSETRGTARSAVADRCPASSSAAAGRGAWDAIVAVGTDTIALSPRNPH